MMIRRIRRGSLVALIYGAWAMSTVAESPRQDEEKVMVEVTIHGVFDLDGELRIELFDDPKKFESGKHGVYHKELVVSPEADPKGTTVVFDGVEIGKEYAIAMFHDRNQNEEFNAANKERFGFSNNAKPRLTKLVGLIPYGGKPPKWETAKFKCCGPEGILTQRIILRKPVVGTPLVDVEGIEVAPD